MAPLCYRRHRLAPEIIQHAIWLYLRFTLSYRDVEELLAERGLGISYETVRRWVLKFGPAIARRAAPASSSAKSLALDEMVVRNELSCFSPCPLPDVRRTPLPPSPPRKAGFRSLPMFDHRSHPDQAPDQSRGETSRYCPTSG